MPTHVRLLVGIVGIITLVAAACGTADDDAVQPGAPEPPPLEPGAVSLWLSADRVPPGDHELVAVMVRHDEGDEVFGVAATVDRWDGSAWVPHRQLAMCLDHWHCTAAMLPLDEEMAVPDIGLLATLGQPGPTLRFRTDGLDAGWYRISQTGADGDPARGVFAVAGGADAPAPLTPLDEPGISVQPAVLLPIGGPVTLSPLVPAGQTGQTIDDLAEAVEGLSETASVEQWDGAAWTHVLDVDLAEAPEQASGAFDRVAEIPALDTGEYRLVRDGPDQAHTGRFWIDDYRESAGR